MREIEEEEQKKERVNRNDSSLLND